MSDNTSYNSPRLVIDVTQERIDESQRRSSAHCMISEAIRDTYPKFRSVSTDLSTIRFTDPARRMRFIYLTPRNGQVALIEFDAGHKVEPFKIILKKQAVKVLPLKDPKEPSEGGAPQSKLELLQTKLHEVSQIAEEKAKRVNDLSRRRRAPGRREELERVRQEAIDSATEVNKLNDEIEKLKQRRAKQRERQARFVDTGGNSIPTIVGGNPLPIGNLARVRTYGLKSMVR